MRPGSTRFTHIRVLIALFGFVLPGWPQSLKNTHQLASASATAGDVAPDAVAASRPLANNTLRHNTFVIGIDDVLAIDVWKEPEISRTVPVRSDGKISLPLIGEMTAAGETPKQLEEELARRLTNYILAPAVTVIVQEIKSQRFNVLGLVVHPGLYPLEGPTTVLDAIALTGGFRDFAKQKAIYVLRRKKDGTEIRIAFNYKDVIQGKNPAQNITLEPHDTIVVP